MIARMFTTGRGENADLLEALAIFAQRDGGRPQAIEAGPDTPIPDQIATDIPRRRNPKAPKGYWYLVLED